MKPKYRAVQYKTRTPWLIQRRNFLGLWITKETANSPRDAGFAIANLQHDDDFKPLVLYRGDEMPTPL